MSTICCCDPTDPTAPCSNVYLATVEGCNALQLPGATVTATRSGYTTRSGTTTTGGVSLSLAPGTWTITVARARFVTQTRTVTVSTFCTFTTQDFRLAPDASYTCYSGCVLPLANVLTASTPIGTTTLTNTGGFWEGTIVRTLSGVTVPTGGGCLGSSGTDAVSTLLRFDPDTPQLDARMVTVGTNVAGDSWGALCPVATFASNVTGGPSQTCPDSFLFTASFGSAWGSTTPASALFTGAVTITE